MNEQKDAAKHEKQAAPEIPPPAPPPVDPPQPPPNPYPEKDDCPKKMSKSEKIMVWATCVIAAGTLVSAAAIFEQWREMVHGSGDTTAIAQAAKQQACAARSFADSAAKISQGIENAVVKLNTQAQQTRELAQTSKDALHTSERAYIEVGIAHFDIPSKTLQLPINNSGHIPSGSGKVTIHEETLDTTLFNATHNALLVERHWTEDRFDAFAPGNFTFMNVFMPRLDEKEIGMGHQKIVVTGTITYNDGFPNTPEQRWLFCIASDVRQGTQTPALFPCNSDEQLPIAIANDKYPNPQYHSKN